MKLRHILVQHRYEAEDVLHLLKQGKDFSDLARKFSICSSARNGGDLGDLSGKKLDSDFEDAIRYLKAGVLSDIVRTRFGYHIIQGLE